MQLRTHEYVAQPADSPQYNAAACVVRHDGSCRMQMLDSQLTMPALSAGCAAEIGCSFCRFLGIAETCCDDCLASPSKHVIDSLDFVIVATNEIGLPRIAYNI